MAGGFFASPRALAHGDIKTTKRYAHLGPDGSMKEVGKRMGRILKLDRLNDVREGPREEYAAG